MLHGLSALIAGGNNHINLLYLLVLLPALVSLAAVLIPARYYMLRAGGFIGALTLNLLFALGVFASEEFAMLLPWGEFGMHLALRVYDFSGFIILCIAVGALIVGVYSVAFLRSKNYTGLFLGAFLLTLALANGAVLANNLVALLFFWEALLVTLFVMIMLGNRRDVSAATKALIISGLADLLLMLGIVITCWRAGTFMTYEIVPLPLEGINTLGFICMVLGALGKAGSMPFHSWIPDAATEAPLPFMAFLPGILEKLLGVYLLVRVTQDFYVLEPGSPMSVLLMSIGAATIILAAAMSLVQNDIKRMLAYSAISQVGYITLAVGTALPVGLVGAMLHMVNHAIYKSCLFLTAGSIERRCGSTDLRELGGLRRLMPITTVVFVLAASAVSGLPPLNSFFSKELIFDAAWESGMVFYIAALLGAFLTVAAFLKLGHAAFFGHLKYPRGAEDEPQSEAPPSMYVPMGILAALCLVFGVGNALPLAPIQEILSVQLAGHDYSGWPHSMLLVVLSLVTILLAVGNHLYGLNKSGFSLKAVDHIRYAPGLQQIYDAAEKRLLDPYEWLMLLVKGYAWLCFVIDRAIDWFYNVFLVRLVQGTTVRLAAFNNGHSSRYMFWAFMGMLLVLLMFVIML